MLACLSLAPTLSISIILSIIIGAKLKTSVRRGTHSSPGRIKRITVKEARKRMQTIARDKPAGGRVGERKWNGAGGRDGEAVERRR